MIGSYWGAIGAAEYKRIQRQTQRRTDALRMHRPGRDRDADRRDHTGAGRKSAGLPGAADAQLSRATPRLGPPSFWCSTISGRGAFHPPRDELASVETRLYLADLAVEAANRAVEIAPNDSFVRGLVARAAWMACQPDLLRNETMRAMELNPNDPQNLGPLGNLMAYAGFWDEGVALAEKGIALTGPSTPRWWWWAVRSEPSRMTTICGPSKPSASRMSNSSGSAIFTWHTPCRSSIGSTKHRTHAATLVADEARLHGQGGRRLLQDVVLCAVVPRKGMRCAADRSGFPKPDRDSRTKSLQRVGPGRRAGSVRTGGVRPSLPAGSRRS